MKNRLILFAAVSAFAVNPCIASPALDFSYSDEGLLLQVSGAPASSHRVEFNDGFGPWAIAAANTGISQWDTVAEMPVDAGPDQTR